MAQIGSAENKTVRLRAAALWKRRGANCEGGERFAATIGGARRRCRRGVSPSPLWSRGIQGGRGASRPVNHVSGASDAQAFELGPDTPFHSPSPQGREGGSVASGVIALPARGPCAVVDALAAAVV